MYGDTGVMRRRATQLRDQGADLRMTADQLVAQTEAVAWTGRAADAMRERIRDRAAQMREVANRHDSAADALESHLHQVDILKDAIADRERRAATLVGDARDRLDAAVPPEPADRLLTDFTPPPAGHKDWLTVELPGL